MSWLRRHLGEWISVNAHAQRAPLRVTVSVAFGELPQGWATAGRSKPARPWLGIAGLVLIAPFVVLIGAAVARQFTGLVGPYELIATSPVAITVATVSLFLGLPVAFALNVWPVTRLGLRRYTGRLEGLLALEIAPLQLAVVVIAVILAALFIGHLAADSYACLNGVRSAC
jgi:hypothetical protein